MGGKFLLTFRFVCGGVQILRARVQVAVVVAACSTRTTNTGMSCNGEGLDESDCERRVAWGSGRPLM